MEPVSLILLDDFILVFNVFYHYYIMVLYFLTLLNSLPTGSDVCHLLIIFANSLDPDQD